MPSQFAGVFGQTVFLDETDRRQRRGAGHRAFLVGVVAQRAVSCHIESLPGDQCRQRQYAPAQPFADDQHVGDDIEILAGEHPACPAEGVRDFVENQKRPVAVAGLADDPPVFRLRDVGGAPDRFCNHRGDVPLLLKDIFHITGAHHVAAAAAAAVVDAVVFVGRRDVFGAGQQRPHVLAKDRLPADGDRVQRRPVKGIPHRDRLVAARGDARKFQGHADRLGAPRAEEDAVEISGGDFGQLLCQIDGDPVGVTPCAEG